MNALFHPMPYRLGCIQLDSSEGMVVSSPSDLDHDPWLGVSSGLTALRHSIAQR